MCICVFVCLIEILNIIMAFEKKHIYIYQCYMYIILSTVEMLE